ncbi:MAG: hypothetical protein ABIQ86_15200 [Steroidobacteraceae bacterium]
MSCAAVLAVYAAGYSRTRDAARRFETQALERRPARPEHPAALGTKAAATSTAAPTAQTPPETRPAISPPIVVATTPSVTAIAAEAPSMAAASAPPSTPAPQPVASSQALLASTETSVSAVAAARVIEPDPVSSSQPDSSPAPSGNWRDGTYTGWGTSRHGDIKAQVVIKNGRIVESSIASCETRYPCDVISDIFNQPVERQNADVDRVSRATESANAYYYALVAALDDALVQPSAQTTTVR